METSGIPKIGGFAKYFMMVMAVAPIVMAIWLATIVPSQNAQGRYLVSVTIAGLVFISLLLVPYIIRVASIRLSVDGVEQVAFFDKGRFGVVVSIKWQSVERVSYRGLAYKLFGGDAEISIYLGCFGDQKVAADFINENLPRNAVWE